jgi:hypothetical protein
MSPVTPMTCREIAHHLRDARSHELVRLEVVMKFCHNCGLSIGRQATFCATCGALVPSAPSCALCGHEAAAADDEGLCRACREALALFVARAPGEPVVSLASSAASGVALATVANAIYSAVADASTCPECAAADGSETTDAAAAAARAPNARCTSAAGCRCLVFFEHERLDVGEEHEFVAFAAASGLRVTAAAVAGFHADGRRRREQTARHLSDAADLLREAARLEKPEPEQAVELYRSAVEALLACGATPLDERAVRHELPLAFNRLTLVLKGLGRDAEALDEIDRAASWGIPERPDCGRKSDREALRNRGRRLRERSVAAVTA